MEYFLSVKKMKIGSLLQFGWTVSHVNWVRSEEILENVAQKAEYKETKWGIRKSSVETDLGVISIELGTKEAGVGEGVGGGEGKWGGEDHGTNDGGSWNTGGRLM